MRVRAAEALLDRAYGRPPQAINVEVPAAAPTISDQEWETLARLRHQVRQLPPATPAGAPDHLPLEQAGEKDTCNGDTCEAGVRAGVRIEPVPTAPMAPEGVPCGCHSSVTWTGG